MDFTYNRSMETSKGEKNLTKLSGKMLVAVALALSLVTAGLVYQYLQSATTKMPEKTNTIVMAKTNIQPKTVITSDMVQESQIPAAYMQPGTVTDRKMAVGVLARDYIAAGEHIVERNLIIEGKSGGFTTTIPTDKRAITIGVNEVSGVAGFVKPGDYVDIVATFDKGEAGESVSRIIMQNILVLAANRDSAMPNQAGSKDSKDKDSYKAVTVTLAVTPQQLTQLALAEEKGKVRLALQPYLPAVGEAATAAVTSKDLVGTYFSPSTLVGRQPGGKQPHDAAPDISARKKEIRIIRGTKTDAVPVK